MESMSRRSLSSFGNTQQGFQAFLLSSHIDELLGSTVNILKYRISQNSLIFLKFKQSGLLCNLSVCIFVISHITDDKFCSDFFSS